MVGARSVSTPLHDDEVVRSFRRTARLRRNGTACAAATSTVEVYHGSGSSARTGADLTMSTAWVLLQNRRACGLQSSMSLARAEIATYMRFQAYIALPGKLGSIPVIRGQMNVGPSLGDAWDEPEDEGLPP